MGGYRVLQGRLVGDMGTCGVYRLGVSDSDPGGRKSGGNIRRLGAEQLMMPIHRVDSLHLTHAMSRVRMHT